MVKVSEYGECPVCGHICQPDSIPTWYAVIEEYAVCCECKTAWNIYRTNITDDLLWCHNIERFNHAHEWYECRDK